MFVTVLNSVNELLRRHKHFLRFLNMALQGIKSGDIQSHHMKSTCTCEVWYGKDAAATYPEEISCLVLTEEQSRVLGTHPSGCNVPRQAATSREFHDQCEVRLCEDRFLGIDDINVAFTEVRLDLQIETSDASGPQCKNPESPALQISPKSSDFP